MYVDDRHRAVLNAAIVPDPAPFVQAYPLADAIVGAPGVAATLPQPIVNGFLHAAEALLDGRGVVDWAIGVVFDPGVKANTRTVGHGFVYALNPLTASGTLAYHVADRASRRALLAVAAHEVAHTVATDHDEAFAALLTDLYARIDQDAADAVMRAATAPAAVRRP